MPAFHAPPHGTSSPLEGPGTKVAWGQMLRLAAVSTATGSTAKKFRSLRLSGLLLAVSGVSSVLLVAALGAKDAADIVALRVMAYGCFLYGGLGLFTLLAPGAGVERPNELAGLRGYELGQSGLTLLAFTRRLTLGMWLSGLPGLGAAAVVSPSGGLFGQRIALFFVAAAYLLSLGLLLGGVGALCLRVAPRAPRTLASALILVPFFLSLYNSSIPHLIGIYSWGLGRMIEWGGVVS